MVQEQTVNKPENVQATPNLTPAQEVLQAVWEAHVQSEFVSHNTEDALATMVEDAYVNHIPVMTGGVGKPAVGEFYSKYFIPQIPPDLELIPVSRTIGTDQLVDEMVAKFTHTVRMDWMIPGIAPTGKQVEVPAVAIIRFRDGKLAHEHIYWDQASVLVQLGLLDPGTLPIVGIDSARKLVNPNLPSNALIDRNSV
ncbi:ester cyclase [Chlorogloeopsis sp. ULAP02]|uniref:ester cyclase n=1 Tax=Chlorogloeopsis sp. ULAP02 TaxID=3107926 RepID=UPI0031352563